MKRFLEILMTEDPEYLGSLSKIIDFTGIPRKTFYRSGYMKLLRSSGYVFSRERGGKYGQTIYWSYRRLILAWLAENFSSPEKNRRG